MTWSTSDDTILRTLADDYADGEIDDVATHRECLELGEQPISTSRPERLWHELFAVL